MFKRSFLAAAVLLLLTLSAPSGASAFDPIEGTWEFNGGAILVEAQPDGTFGGIVTKETTFSTCPHQVGEKIWTAYTQQPDGQYFGLHQFFNNSTCEFVDPGKSAIRLLVRPEDGKTFMRFCSAAPGSGLQPSIAPDGTTSNNTDPCLDSKLLAPPSAPPTAKETFVLPKQSAAKKCMSKRNFTIRLREPKNGDTLVKATVTVNSKLVETLTADRITAPVNLTGLPKGRYSVKIVATTATGKTISGTRKYRTCTKKRKGGKIKI